MVFRVLVPIQLVLEHACTIPTAVDSQPGSVRGADQAHCLWPQLVSSDLLLTSCSCLPAGFLCRHSIVTAPPHMALPNPTSCVLPRLTLVPQYYDKCRPVSSSKESYDADVARRFWERSAELVGLP